jgi:hypothetical protein
MLGKPLRRDAWAKWANNDDGDLLDVIDRFFDAAISSTPRPARFASGPTVSRKRRKSVRHNRAR